MIATDHKKVPVVVVVVVLVDRGLLVMFSHICFRSSKGSPL